MNFNILFIINLEKFKKLMKVKFLILFSILISQTIFAERVTCKKFKTQSEAQAYFMKHKGKNLDRDGDGQACDCLPGGNGKKCPKKK
ncbi:MAG: excalibur calcium-binding domain-containing protein [Bacilli bacterium]